MVISASKSSTKRPTFSTSAAASAAEDAGSANRGGALRRSRSLSRHSGPAAEPDGLRSPGGRSVSKTSDSDFPEISLDDLADEFFRRQNMERGERDDVRPAIGRSRRTDADAGYLAETNSSRRRGRSTSRTRGPAPVEGNGSLKNGGEERGVLAGRLRSQRSFSVARSLRGDSEVTVNVEPTLLVNGHCRNSKAMKNTAEIRRNYDTKLKPSEYWRQDLLAKLAVKEQCGQELSKIVPELPARKQTVLKDRPSRSIRRRSNRARISKDLTEEAEKIFEDFLSNIEDTDLSSYDGERSETSSTLGGSVDSKFFTSTNTMAEIHGNLTFAPSTPVEKDGVVLPWLQWETKFPSPSKSKVLQTVASGCSYLDKSQEVSNDNSNYLTSSHGSWSPEVNDRHNAAFRDITGFNTEEVESRIGAAVSRPKSSFDMDDYLHLQQREDLLFEMVRQRHRIDSGSLILCGRIF